MSLPNLSPDQFPQFFEAVHGYPPFLWQSRMAAEVLATGEWPENVSLPTSAGKTALIDIAVFALACEAHLPASERRVPLRIFFVIDRRVVADEAFGRAAKIAKALDKAIAEKSREAILLTVATRLQHLAGPDACPLHCALLRGGIALDDQWIRSPLQPTVCVSTVDQVGSRLLFRGYGVPPRQRSMHAALIAHDSLLIVDEAHISKPLCETVRAIQRYAARGELAVIRPLRLVQMTATAVSAGNEFTLQPDEAAEPELEKRIVRKKPTTLEAVGEGEEEHSQPALVTRAVAIAQEWATKQPRVIGIVVNRVLTARRIFEALDKELGEKVLFIGRARPLDRDRLWKKWRQHLTSDPRERVHSERALFVVATQTIEVGADLDFDALISELAPIDALRQRFGRLNRRGRDIAVEAFVLATKEQIGTRYDDPVYGKSLAPSWKWLQAQLDGRGRTRTVNFSYTNLKTRLEAADAETIAAMRVLSPRVPILHRPFLEAWACTAAPLMHDPDIALFLHGEQPPQLEVQVVWRADFDEALFHSNPLKLERYEERLDAMRGLVQLLPPSSREALPLPIFTAVRWLQRLATPELTDTSNSKDREPDRDRFIRTVLVWRGGDNIQFIRRRHEIQPGDVIMVPSSYGGADAFGWMGTSAKSEPVTDIAEEAAWSAGRRPFLRLHANVFAQHGVQPLPGLLDAAKNEEFPLIWKDWLDRLAATPLANEVPEWRERLRAFARLQRSEAEDVADKANYAGAILRSKLARDPLTTLWADDGNDEASQTASIQLKEHLAGVAGYAEKFAAAAGVATSLVKAIHNAAKLHDLGKADPRTQVIFHGTEASAFAAIAKGTLLAKSDHRLADPRARRQLYRLAGLPKGARHEALSVFLAQSESGGLADVEDRDLVLHLIAAHHGYARPFLKPLEQPDSDPDSVDLRPIGLAYSGPVSYDATALAGGVGERFLSLQQRYGWWGLAWLETLLRLADWARSAAEQKSFPKQG